MAELAATYRSNYSTVMGFITTRNGVAAVVKGSLGVTLRCFARPASCTLPYTTDFKQVLILRAQSVCSIKFVQESVGQFPIGFTRKMKVRLANLSIRYPSTQGNKRRSSVLSEEHSWVWLFALVLLRGPMLLVRHQL